jgi:predicted DNA-binding ribbon-helix-helix protein
MEVRMIMVGDCGRCVRLETEFWDVLEEIAVHRGISLRRLIADCDSEVADLASALRVRALQHVLEQAGRSIELTIFATVRRSFKELH